MTTVSLHDIINQAAEPVSQFWPMKGFVSHNPLQGLEHLPFDEAFRQAKHLFGAEGYLPVETYRQQYQRGRIKAENVEKALKRIGPKNDAVIKAGQIEISASLVYKLHLLYGFDGIEPALLNWRLTSGGALNQRVEGTSTDTTYPNQLLPLWEAVKSALTFKQQAANEHPSSTSNASVKSAIANLPFQTSLSDWMDTHHNTSIVTTIDQQIIKWTSSFTDEGMASWSMPDRRKGFYSVWRELAQHDASGRLLGIKQFGRKVADLPEDPEQAIAMYLEQLAIPQSRWPDYITRVLAQLPGWTGLIRWRGFNPDDPIQKAAPIDIVQYLAVRMFYENELIIVHAKRTLGCSGTLADIAQHMPSVETAESSAKTETWLSEDAWRLFKLAQRLPLTAEAVSSMDQDAVTQLLSWLDDFPVEKQLPVWLEAYEDAFRVELLGKIQANHKKHARGEIRPLAQAAFCIDVRSEPFRRHVESAGDVETLGYAGFFGIPISHRSYDTEESFPLCPVLLSPSQAVYELPRDGQDQALSQYASGSRWMRFASQLFHDMKHSPIASFILVDVLGLFFSIALLGKTLFRNGYNWLSKTFVRFFKQPLDTEISAGESSGPKPCVEGVPIDLERGFSIEQQANFVEGGLRMIGLTSNFGRFFVLCGHGSTTDNNPYSAALDCGACGGRHGDPNARVFAKMANNPDVREELKSRGLEIPQDTWFLAAKHDTTADTVAFYDLADVPESHQNDLQELNDVFVRGGQNQAQERLRKVPGAPDNMTPEQAFAHAKSRSVDWATTRPEWGLSGNAAFVIGRRTMTKGLDLEGRCFMHSYNALSDPEGANLEKIMTAPMVVTEWINMQYYTSATDPWKYGSGSKVIHNVVGGLGVMYGAQSDLATGLPLQTVNDGDEHFHEPVRLLILIEAEMSNIGNIIDKHAMLQQFFHNGWLNLVAINPHSGEFQRYTTEGVWEDVGL